MKVLRLRFENDKLQASLREPRVQTEHTKAFGPNAISRATVSHESEHGYLVKGVRGVCTITCRAVGVHTFVYYHVPEWVRAHVRTNVPEWLCGRSQ